MNDPTVAGRIVKWASILWIVAWSLGPIVIGVVTSFSSQKDVRAVPARWVPHELTTEAYRQLLLGTSGGRAGGTVTEAGVFSQQQNLMGTALPASRYRPANCPASRSRNRHRRGP